MTWKIEVHTVGPLQMNSVLLLSGDPDHNEAILIDPGAEPERLLGRIAETGAQLVGLLATHGHFDHVAAAAAIQAVHALPLRCHRDDVPLIERMPETQAAYGFEPDKVPVLAADLEDGMTVPFAGSAIRVAHVPGHSPGQLMFRLPDTETETPTVIVGDCLFAGSVGRTDLPGGDFETLEKSIRERIYTLPNETVVVCGHGPDTSVGREKTSNPFVRE